MKLFISPHNDDETLFGALLIMKEKPAVVVVFDSFIQVERGNENASKYRRRAETIGAMHELEDFRDELKPHFIGLRDDAPDYDYFRAWLKQRRDDGQFDGIICPAWEHGGHEQHNEVARICRDLWPDDLRTEYLTYTRTFGRSRAGNCVRGYLQGSNVPGAHPSQYDPAVEVIPTPDMIARKHRALACYTSQMEVENCRDWFLGDLREYVVLPPAGSDGRGVDGGGPR